MINKIFDNFKQHFIYDILYVVFVILWLVTSFLLINLGKVPFWSSLFYLGVINFLMVYGIIGTVRLVSYKLSNLLVNAIVIIIAYNLTTKVVLNREVFVAFSDAVSFGVKNAVFIKIGLIFLLALTLYKKITTKHFSALFGIMFVTNIVMNIPNIYTNVMTKNGTKEQKIIPDEKLMQYKNPTRPNVYVLMTDTYPSFYNLREFLNFDNKGLENYLTQNNFTNYDKMYSNFPATHISMSSFFGGEAKERSDIYADYYIKEKEAGHYLNQKYLTALKEEGYEVSHNGYVDSFGISHHYLTGFFNYMDISIKKKHLKTYLYLDKDLLDNIKYQKEKMYYGVAQSLGMKAKNTITISFSGTIKSWLPCYNTSNDNFNFMSRAYTIEKIKCSNEIIKKSVDTIQKYDKNALIIVMSDHGHIYTERIKWVNKDNRIEKGLGVLLSIKYPKQCKSYANVNFTSLQSVMPLALGCVRGLSIDEVEKTLSQDEYSYVNNDIKYGSIKKKASIINGKIQSEK